MFVFQHRHLQLNDPNDGLLTMEIIHIAYHLISVSAPMTHKPLCPQKAVRQALFTGGKHDVACFRPNVKAEHFPPALHLFYPNDSCCFHISLMWISHHPLWTAHIFFNELPERLLITLKFFNPFGGRRTSQGWKTWNDTENCGLRKDKSLIDGWISNPMRIISQSWRFILI